MKRVAAGDGEGRTTGVRETGKEFVPAACTVKPVWPRDVL